MSKDMQPSISFLRPNPMINKKTDDLCLVVTERCNLNCTYCQSNKTFKQNMSWEVAKKNIDTYLSTTEVKRPSITFMGGEPFIAFRLIKQIVAYVDEEYRTHKVSYTVVTNGTLVHGEIQDWIKINEDKVHVILSLDGLGDTHNKNRSNSLNKIDIEFFRSLKRPVVNSVFTLDTIKYLANTVIELHEKGFNIKAFIADGEQWGAGHIGMIAEQLMQLITFYLDHPTIYPVSLLSQPLYYLLTSDHIRRCGTDDFSEVSVSADGSIWACHRCSPFENHGTWTIPEKYLSLKNARYLLPACETCFLENICNACPASNASIKDNVQLAETMCNIRKLLFKANAYFSISMLTNNIEYAALRHLTADKKRLLADSAKKILEKLS